MPRILEDRETHATIQTDDGDIELISWASPRNVLLYKHGLADLIKHGTEVWTANTEHGYIVIQPEDGGRRYQFSVDKTVLSVPPHRKTDFLDALFDAYGTDPNTPIDYRPLLDFAHDLMDTKVAPPIVDQFLDAPVFDAVERTDDGWLINDLALLTYDCELYQPETRRTNRTGEVVEGGANKLAYDVSFRARLNTDGGQTALPDYDSGYLARQSDIIDFLARAMWAVHYVSEGVDPR